MPRHHWCYFLGNYPDNTLTLPSQYAHGTQKLIKYIKKTLILSIRDKSNNSMENNQSN